MSTYNFIVEGVLLISVGCLGVIGNVLCIIWFTRKTVQKSFHQIMLTLAIYDLLYVLISIFLFGIPTVYGRINEFAVFKYIIIIILPCAHIGLTGTIYLTLAIAVERYTTVCHPFFKLSHSWSATFYIIPISLFSVFYNIPKFFEHRVVVRNLTETLGENVTALNFTRSVIEPTDLRKNADYIKVYLIILNFVVHGVIPLVMLTILNILVYKQLRTMQLTNLSSSDGYVHHKDIKLAYISLAIVGVFIICHSVRWIPNIWELKQIEEGREKILWPGWIQGITSLSHLLTVFNSSVNFYIYSYKQYKRSDSSEERRISELQSLGTTRIQDCRQNYQSSRRGTASIITQRCYIQAEGEGGETNPGQLEAENSQITSQL